MSGVLLLSASAPIGHPALGVVIPAAILAVSFVATWLLHRHFSKM
jgi:hypothetical protein